MHQAPLLRLVWFLSFNAIALPLMVIPAIAQSPPPGVTPPSENLQRVDQIIPPPFPTPPLPEASPQPAPSTELEVPATPTPPPQEPPPAVRFKVDRIEVLGSTVLQDEIAALTSKLEGQMVSFEELVQLRSDITQLYIDNGYITSGAFIPNNQILDSGTVRIQVVEGSLEDLQIEGLSRLRDGYVRSRVRLGAGTPLNEPRLRQSLQLLQLDPLIQQVNAELTAGSAPGRNILKLRLLEASAFSAGISFANNQSTSIGADQGSIFASYGNVTGWGDRLTVEYGRTDGLSRYDISYAIPVNPREGNLSLRYGRNNSEIIEAQFQDLGIRSESETIGVNFRQPLMRSPNTEFALSLGLDVRRSQTFILDDIPFSFSEGPVRGRAKVSVIRFAQDWLDRDATRVLAARSQFNLGIDAFDATVNDSGIDGRFFSWIGQFQWVQQVTPRLLFVSRVDAQLTPDALLSLEQFSLGGGDTVRGYRQNQLVADNGIFAGVEARISLTRNPATLQLTPFIDLGTGWNNRLQDPDPGFIASVGAGIRWQPLNGLSLRVDYGIPLVDVGDRGDSLQERGITFSVRYQPF